MKSLNQVLNIEQPSCLLLCKGTLTCTVTSLELKNLPPKIENLLKEFEDIFPKEGPVGLPPFRGIEHQIDFLCLGLVCQIDQPIGQILKKQRR